MSRNLAIKVPLEGTELYLEEVIPASAVASEHFLNMTNAAKGRIANALSEKVKETVTFSSEEDSKGAIIIRGSIVLAPEHNNLDGLSVVIEDDSF